MGRKLILIFSATLVVATCFAPTASAQARQPVTTAVIALNDTGINPYHRVFRDDSPQAYQHPSTYIPGYPKDAEAVHLSLDEKNYETAVKKDCDVWKGLVPNKLYWFPGTKIIGGIALNSIGGVGQCPQVPILDGNGHGTMTASRAAANGYGACPECRIVAIQGTDPGVQWAADNSNWIDIQTNSWGPLTPGWVPVGTTSFAYSTPAFVRMVESSARKHLAFWASGNGAGTRVGWLGHPTLIDPRMTPSIVMVGGHDSGYVNTWPDFPPHVVADSCFSWAAYHDKIEESDADVGGGTSAASPYSAGIAGRILIEARRLLGDPDTGVEHGIAAQGAARVSEGPLADGELTLDEWKEVLFKTATPRPKGERTDGKVCGAIDGPPGFHALPVKWTDVPDDYPEYLHIGYGATDSVAAKLAFQVLAGRKPLPDRSETDRYFETDAAARAALHGVFRGP